MELEQYGELLANEIALSLLAFDNPSFPIDELGDLCIELTKQLQALGILALLTRAETDLFQQNIILSAKVRQKYLDLLAKQKITDAHHSASGRYQAQLGAIAGFDFGLAHDLIRSAQANWFEGHEYEDDYCYAQVLDLLLKEESDSINESLDNLLQRWQEFWEGVPCPKLDVCRAIKDKNQADFDEQFENLILEIDDTIEKNIKQGELDTPEVEAHRLINIEALALLNLAETHGLTVQPEYKYCPPLARIRSVVPIEIEF